MRATARVHAAVRAIAGVRFCTSCQKDCDPAGFVHVNHKRWVCATCNQRRIQQLRKPA